MAGWQRFGEGFSKSKEDRKPSHRANIQEEVDEIRWSESSSDEEVKFSQSQSFKSRKRKLFTVEAHESIKDKTPCSENLKRQNIDLQKNSISRSLYKSFDSVSSKVNSFQKSDKVTMSQVHQGTLSSTTCVSLDAKTIQWANSSFGDIDPTELKKTQQRKKRRYEKNEETKVNIDSMEGSPSPDSLNEAVEDIIEDSLSSSEGNGEKGDDTLSDHMNRNEDTICSDSDTPVTQEASSADKQPSPSIDTQSPVKTSDSTKIKASDWVMAAQKHTTPNKDKNKQEDHGADSAKKKRKYTKGSLASQLLFLMKREKTSVRFWIHSLKCGSTDDKNQKAMRVRLMTLKCQWSLFVSMCHILEHRETEREDGDSQCQIMFHRDTVERLSLKVGKTVDIFPPWQQLDEASGLRTILCSHYVTLANGECNETESRLEPEHCDQGFVTVNASWRCPCSIMSCTSDFSKTDWKLIWNQITCSYQNQPFKPKYPSDKMPGHTSTTTDTARNKDDSPVSGETRLHSIDVTPSQSTSSKVFVKRTLLESMECPLQGRNYLPSFTASVLRVFRHCDSINKELVYELLLEDSAGTLALVTLCGTGSCNVALTDGLWCLEGKTCSCSGLSVVGRTTRDRNISVFSVVEVAWTQRYHQDTSQESQSQPQKVKAPSFCYLLEGGDSTTPVFETIQTDSQVPLGYNVMSTLQEVFEIASTNRVSVIARAVQITDLQLKQTTSSPHLYILLPKDSQSSEVTEVIKVEVRNQCSLDDLDSCVSLCLLKDIFVENGQLVCDKYSTLISQNHWEQRAVTPKLDPSLVQRIISHTLSLPSVSDELQFGDLISVQGTIRGVDESTAFSWEECDICGCAQLVVKEGSNFLFCLKCERKVDCPVTKMKMEVFVSVEGKGEHTTIRLELSQKTIQSLLPSETDDEGHDVDTVIGQSLQCPVCVVLTTQESSSNNTQRGTRRVEFKLRELDLDL